MGWTLIQHTALTSSAASVTLGSGGTIPQTYKSLKLVISSRCTRTSNEDPIVMTFNGGAQSTGSGRNLNGNGSAASSGTDSNFLRTGNSPGTTNTANTFGSTEVTIANYTVTNANKPVSVDDVYENNGTAATQTLIAGLWASNSAVSSITLALFTGSSFVSGSTFTLYGLS